MKHDKYMKNTDIHRQLHFYLFSNSYVKCINLKNISKLISFTNKFTFHWNLVKHKKKHILWLGQPLFRVNDELEPKTLPWKINVTTMSLSTRLAGQPGWDAWQGHLRAFGGLQGHCGQGVLGTPRARLFRPTPGLVQVGAGFTVGWLGLVSGCGGLLQVAAGLASGCCRACCCTRILPQLALRLRLGCCGAGQVVDGPRGRSGGKPQVPDLGLSCFTGADSSLLASACGA